jgi:hypothetical protein
MPRSRPNKHRANPRSRSKVNLAGQTILELACMVIFLLTLLAGLFVPRHHPVNRWLIALVLASMSTMAISALVTQIRKARIRRAKYLQTPNP